MSLDCVVEDDQLSLAIGKKGQNVRLASQLTGWRIDIHSASKVTEMEARARQSLAAISGVTAEVAEALFKAGWRSAAEVAKPEELTSVTGIANAQAAQTIITAAGPAAEAERVRHAAEAARAAQQAADEAAAAASAAAAAAEAASASAAAEAASAPNPEAP